MNVRLWLIVTFACIVIASGLSFGVTPCGSAPAGIVACYNITVQNRDTSNAIATNSELNLTFNGLGMNTLANGAFNNWVIYNGITGNIVRDAWFEGSTSDEYIVNGFNTIGGYTLLVWIDTNSPIGASVTATNAYTLGFYPMSANMMGTNGIGEAPQLTCANPSTANTGLCNYGQYDNGANVFITYQNWTGTSTPSGWTSTLGASSQNNGITQTTGTLQYLVSTANYGDSISKAVDMLGVAAGGTAADYLNWGFTNSGGSSTGSFVGFYSGSGGSDYYYTAGTSATPNLIASSILKGTVAVFTSWFTSTSANMLINYANPGNVGAPVNIPMAIPIGVHINSLSSSFYMQWIRVRTNYVLPPTITNSTRESISAGTTISITPDPAGYGNTPTVIASCLPNTDTCAVDFPLGTHMCTGTGTCSYVVPVNAIGTYTYYANDITSGGTQSEVLSISKGTPTLSCTNNANSLVNYQTFGNYLFANSIISCTIQSAFNQLTANLNYNGVTENSGTTTMTYNAQWNNLFNTANFIETGNGNYFPTNVNFAINDVVYTIVQNPTAANPGYETGTYPFNYNLNITKAATSANVLFYVNNVFTANSLSIAIPTTNQIFPFSNTIPLLPINNIMITFNGFLTVQIGSNWGGKFISEGIFNTINQQQLWDYIPSVTFASGNIVLGQNETAMLNVNDLASLGQLSSINANVQINGNANAIGDVATGGYNFNGLIYSFVPQNYGLASPAIGSPISVTPVNQVVQLFFAGANVYRNVTGLVFNAFQPAIVPCGGGNTVTLNWNFFKAPPIAAQTSNVFLSGFYVATLNTYNGIAIPGSAAGITATATSNTYSSCIYPSWGQFDVQGTFQYNDSNPANSIVAYEYLVNQQVSNIPANINLYLTVQGNPSQYDIVTQNISSGTDVASLVQILLFLTNTNTSIVVGELKTAANGGAVTTLEISSSYKFFAYSLNTVPSKLLGQAGYIQATSCAPNTCLQIIPIGSVNNGYLPTILNNVQQKCTQTPGSGNIMTISCTFLSLNSSSQQTRLQIFKQYSNQPVFNSNVIGSSGSIIGTVSNVNSILYTYYFQLNVGGTWVTISQNQFGTQANIFGGDGGFIALMFTIVLVLVFVTINFNLAIIVGGAGMIISGLLGFITLPSLAVGALMLLIGVTLYIINRDTGNR